MTKYEASMVDLINVDIQIAKEQGYPRTEDFDFGDRHYTLYIFPRQDGLWAELRKDESGRKVLFNTLLEFPEHIGTLTRNILEAMKKDEKDKEEK